MNVVQTRLVHEIYDRYVLSMALFRKSETLDEEMLENSDSESVSDYSEEELADAVYESD